MFDTVLYNVHCRLCEKLPKSVHTLSYINIFYKCINVPIVHTLPTPKRRPAKMTGIEDHWMYDGSPLNFCASGSAMHRHYLQMINYCLTVLTVCWKYEWTFTKLHNRRITWTQLYRMYTVCITERDICVLCMTETVSHTLISALSCWQNVTPQGTCGTPFLQNIFLLRKFSIFSPCSRNRQLNNVKVFILKFTCGIISQYLFELHDFSSSRIVFFNVFEFERFLFIPPLVVVGVPNPAFAFLPLEIVK